MFEHSNMGIQALKSHSEGKKHIAVSQNVAFFFNRQRQNLQVILKILVV